MKKVLLATYCLCLAAMFSPTVVSAENHHGSVAGYPAGHQQALGPLYGLAARKVAPQPTKLTGSISELRHWNRIAIDASGLDHTPVAAGEARVFGEQLGPARSSRAMAIVHIAIFDAVNSINGRYRSYNQIQQAIPFASIDAAVAQAAHDTLIALFPSQKVSFDLALAESLSHVPSTWSRDWGVQAGKRSAAAMLARRASDGSAHPELRVGIEFITGTAAGNWRQDPVSRVPIALGARWDEVQPFVINSASQFRIPPPPQLGSVAYAVAFNEVKTLGGDGIHTPTSRSADQTEAGIYWAYDGTPSLCAPPRLYNQIAVNIADQMQTSDVDLARLLALVNTAMADAGIASWESKYYYEFWRPITGIRESDPGTGPSGSGDGNPATRGDPSFMPLGAPASNLTGPNFTPPFPAYPSGHATFGGALFQTLRKFYRRDNVAFTFTSDEFNGSTVDNNGNVRPLRPRSFSSFSQAEEENGQSRIYLGIHWAFDKTAGISQGRKVANYVYNNVFQPL
jgi:PAP2 superfamily